MNKNQSQRGQQDEMNRNQQGAQGNQKQQQGAQGSQTQQQGAQGSNRQQQEDSIENFSGGSGSQRQSEEAGEAYDYE